MTIIKATKPAETQPQLADSFIQGAPDSPKPTGRGIVKGKKEQVSVILDPRLLDRVDAAADAMGLSRSAYISMALSKELKNSE